MCPSCGYESRHTLGNPDMDQILTDVNTEFSEYRLFVCKKESKFIHMDIYDKHFNPICPADGTELIPAIGALGDDDNSNSSKGSGTVIDNLPDRCPRCNQSLIVEVTKPLAADSAAD